MKKSRFSEERIAYILRQAESGTIVAEVCRQNGVSEQTFYRWKKRYGGSSRCPLRGWEQLLIEPVWNGFLCNKAE